MKPKLGLTALVFGLGIIGCGQNYEKVTIRDLKEAPSQYIDKYVEVQAEECGLSATARKSGEHINRITLYVGEAFLSQSVYGGFKSSEKIHDEVVNKLAEEFKDYDNEPIVVRGKFNKEYELDVKAIIVNGKKFKF